MSEPTPLDRKRSAKRSEDNAGDVLEAELEANAAVAKLDGAKPGPGELGGPDPSLPPPRDLTGRLIATPAKVAVILTCPSCSQTSTIEATLSSRVVRDSDGSGSLALRTRAAKVGHVCGQQALGLVEGPRSR